MIKKRPSIPALAALIAFTAGCFATAVYLWIAFGGPIPLKPQGYEMKVAVRDGQGLVAGTDVRIAGVNIGSVQGVELNDELDRTVATLEIEDEFAPRPIDTKAIVRQRSLLGERYVELSAGTAAGPTLEEGGTLDPAQVDEQVSFEDVIATFDEETRDELSSWLTEYGAGLEGGGQSLSAVLAALDPLAVETGEALEVVRRQQEETSALIREGGGALSALSERQGQLSGLIANSARTFRATAAKDEEFADAMTILPTFLDELRVTSARNAEFSEDTKPLLDQLRPAATELTPVARDLEAYAPDLRRALKGTETMARTTKKGVPAVLRYIEVNLPALESAIPWIGGIVPIFDYATLYRREITGAVANLAATTQATLPPAGGGAPAHYVRGSLPISLEAIGAFSQQFGTNRSNPYPAPGQALDLAQGLPLFGDYLCVNRTLPTISPALSADITTALGFYYTDVPTNPNPVDPPSPPCRSQAPLGPTTNSGGGSFPNVQPLP